ncbi:MAG: glycine cleavage system aminomethyltransferase GcvT [Desulfurococcales archaeon]|nr:glycine cleavage system aminomethyltransferase GcvT [Desulfurococcales archaeon]
MGLRVLPLEELHERLGATFGEFAGWRVPMYYTSTIEEHLAVRSSAGIFDISHMGRLRLRGAGVLEVLEKLYTKRLSKTREGWMSGPTLALNEYARVKDDEMFYKVSDEEWLVVPNAAVADEMARYIEEWAGRLGVEVEVEDLRSDYALLALQGPEAERVVEELGGSEIASLKPLQFITNTSLAGAEIYVASRSGWTGEDGFEFWISPGEAVKLYEALLGRGVKPVGIASRDSLRIEMGFVLGGHEYGEDPRVFPCALSLRYGLGAIDWKKTGFVGEPALRACRREGVRWVRLGIVMKKKYARFIPRQGYKIVVEDQVVGWVTSGTYSPVRKRGVGQAYIDTRYAILGEPVEVVSDKGRRGEAKLEDFPLIKK